MISWNHAETIFHISLLVVQNVVATLPLFRGFWMGMFPMIGQKISGKQKIIPVTLIFPLFHISTTKKSVYLMMSEWYCTIQLTPAWFSHFPSLVGESPTEKAPAFRTAPPIRPDKGSGTDTFGDVVNLTGVKPCLLMTPWSMTDGGSLTKRKISFSKKLMVVSKQKHIMKVKTCKNQSV